MYPILERYGPFFLYSFTVSLTLGLLLATGLAAWQARHRSFNAPWLDGVLVALVAGVLGGRVVYVAVNWDYFQQQLDEIWLVWHGGLSYHGAVLAALVALWLWHRVQGIAFGPTAGLLAPSVVLLSAFGWLACYLEGCAYGSETFIGLLSADLPDSYGVYAVRYQTQLLGILLSLASFAIIWLLRRRLRPLALFWLALFLISSSRFVISFLRGDPVPVVNSIRLDTIADAILALISISALAISSNQSPITDLQDTL
jgi:phosphatidylglycerol:prolipoprotein diacylglycerol transferase